MTVEIVICLVFSRWFVDYDEFCRAMYFIGRPRTHNLVNVIKRMEFRRELVFLVKRYNEYCFLQYFIYFCRKCIKVRSSFVS